MQKRKDKMMLEEIKYPFRASCETCGRNSACEYKNYKERPERKVSAYIRRRLNELKRTNDLTNHKYPSCGDYEPHGPGLRPRRAA